MKDLSLVVKIGAGFGLVLLLLLIVSITGWRGLTTVLTGLDQYRTLTAEASLAAELRQHLSTADATIKDFLISGSDTAIESHRRSSQEIATTVDEAVQKADSPDEKQRLQALQNEFATYQTTTGTLIELRARYIDLVEQQLHTLGARMAEELAAMMDQGRRDRDDVATYQAGMALRNLLNGQINALNFLQYSRPADAEQCLQHLTQLAEETRKISKLVFDESLLARNRSVATDTTAYVEVFQQVVALVQQRDGLVAELLTSLTPELSRQMDDIRHAAATHQEQLGGDLLGSGGRARFSVVVMAAAALLFGGVCALLLTRAITRPILRTADFASTMATGDFTQQLAIEQQDEIGTMARALNSMVRDLKTMLTDIIDDTAILADSSTQLKGTAGELTAAAGATSTRASTVAAAAEQMNTNMQSVAGAMEQSAQNTQLVAAATDELTGTVDKIAANAESARGIAVSAVAASQQTSRRMDALGNAATQIGKVTETITEISEQTNLLALNATIEAARAGEAGKGFAVVANEIKELARQTADATVDIRRQIETMQETTGAAVSDIAEISGIIDKINQVIASIGEAVDEQQAATREIAGKVAETSQGIGEVNEHVAQSSVVAGEITRDITAVYQAAERMSKDCKLVAESADQLSELSARLSDMTSTFKV